MRSLTYSVTTTGRIAGYDRTTTTTVSADYGRELTGPEATAELRRMRLVLDDDLADADREALHGALDAFDGTKP